MNQSFRLGAAIIVFVSILFLARNQVAGAGSQTSPSISAREDEQTSVLLAPKDECKDKKNKDKDKCKGTVKPPKDDIIIPVTGSYSVGGLCSLTVDFTEPQINLNATLIEPLPGELPTQLHQPAQGCLLTYFRTGQTLFELLPASGSATICFAGTPGEQMMVYFYDLYSATPAWAPVPETTTLENGIVCGPANASGVYIATFTS